MSRGNHHPATRRSKAFLTNGWSFLQAFLSWASLLRAIPDMFASLEEMGRVCDEHRQLWALCPLTPCPAQPNRLASKKQGNQGSHPAPHAALDKLSRLPPPWGGGGVLPASWCRQLTREQEAGLPSPGPHGMRCDLHFMVTQSSREAKPQAQVTQLPGAAWGGAPCTRSSHLPTSPALFVLCTCWSDRYPNSTRLRSRGRDKTGMSRARARDLGGAVSEHSPFPVQGRGGAGRPPAQNRGLRI